MWCSLELACLVQQLLAPDAPPSASVPLTPNFDSAPPAKPPAAATAESGAVAAAAAAADVADGAAEGGVGVSARGDSSSSSANGGCSSEESGGSGFKRAYWHACTNVERFLKVSDGLSSKSPRVSEALVRPINSERAYWHACTNVERFLKVCRRVGLRDVSLFTSPDLVDGRDDQHLLTPMSPVIPPLFPRSSPSVPLVSLPFSPETLSVPPCPPCPPPLPVSSRCAYLSPQVCRRVGLRDVSLFTSPDLVDGRDVRRVCLCLRTLSKRLVGIRDFDGIITERKEQQQQKQFTQATATESLDSEPPDSDALSSTNRETGVSSGRESSVQGDSATGAAAVTGAAGAAGAAGLASHGHAAESQNAPAWFGLKEDERRSMAGAIPAGLPSLRVHGRPVGERVGGAMQPAAAAASAAAPAGVPTERAAVAGVAVAGSARVRGQDWRGERADAWHGGHEQRHVYHRHSQQHPHECDRARGAPHKQHHPHEGHEQQQQVHHRYHQHTDPHRHTSASEARQNSHRLSEYHRGLEQKQKQSGEGHLGGSAAAAVPATAGAGARAAAASAAPVDVSPRFLPPDPTSLTPVLPDHLSSPRRVASPLSRTHSNASSTSTALHSTHSLSRHSYTRGSHRSHSHALGLVGEGEGEQRRRGVWDLVAAAGAVALVGGAMVLANRSNRRTREERRRRALEYERPSFTDHIAQRPHLGMGFGGVFELNFGDTPVAAAATDAPDGEGAEGIEGGMERGRAGGRDGGREGGADLAAGEEERAGLGRREARRPWFMSLGSQRNSTSTGEARSTTSTTGSSSNATSSSGGWRRGPKPLPRWQQAELVLRQQREMVIRRLHGDRRSMAEIWWVRMGAGGWWWVVVGADGCCGWWWVLVGAACDTGASHISTPVVMSPRLDEESGEGRWGEAGRADGEKQGGQRGRGAAA
ncbi:unnamed protein product [Closterium sp. NIES-64]|nr:unnamed protein product [Closterium sp. NIES-64]